MSTRVLVALASLAAAPLLAQLASPTGNLGVPMGHLHLTVRDIDAQRQFWVAFGGTAITYPPGSRSASRQTRGRYKTGDIGGPNLTYGEANEKAAPTKGRALDHIGFEVASMDLFAQKLQAQGIDFDMPPRNAPNGTTKIAFLTDPLGTYIELTQGLAPAK